MVIHVNENLKINNLQISTDLDILKVLNLTNYIFDIGQLQRYWQYINSGVIFQLYVSGILGMLIF